VVGRVGEWHKKEMNLWRRLGNEGRRKKTWNKQRDKADGCWDACHLEEEEDATRSMP
jgi:hypothetical protein